MQVAFYDRTGPAQTVLQLADWPDPQPGPGELRVRLRWSGINPSDVKSRAGLRSSVLAYPRIVPHSDGMGVVDAVGAGVDAARIGQRVWVWNAAWGRAFGTAAQYVVLPAAQAQPLPDNVADEAGACLGIPALTALHAVLLSNANGGGIAGQRVLVTGGAGAVGHYAVQMAQLLGAQQVIATTSTPEKAALARAAGADATVDYRQPDAAEQVRQATGGQGIDRVIDVVFGANAARALELLRPGGDYVVYGSAASPFPLPFFPLIVKNLNLRFFIVYNLAPADRAVALATLDALLRRGRLQHQIAARLPLAQIALAHEQVEQGRSLGNVVLAIPQA
ncbi:MAG: NADPH:quinone reductase [Aquabacterium sp.]|nr:NADPH:quinone reductase [Aquabacterium sp.]